MHDQSCRETLTKDRFLKRRDDQFRRHGVGDVPTDDLARKQVHPVRQIRPLPVLERQVGDVADEHLSRTINFDLSFQEQIRAHPLTMPGIGRAWHKTPRLNGSQTLLAHQPPHPMPPGFTPQLGGDPPRTVATRVAPEDLFYLRRELILTLSSLSPSVVAATTHPKQVTQNHCRVSGRLAGDETIDHGHVCRLKMLKAFFKMSRSISTCFRRRRSRSISSSAAWGRARAARFQRWIRFSLIPRASATERGLWPLRTMANACCLNSSSYLRRRRVVFSELRVDSDDPFFIVVSLIF